MHNSRDISRTLTVQSGFWLVAGLSQRLRFLVRAEGDSMQPMIEGRQLSSSAKTPGGSRNGKIVLCRIERFAGDAPVAVIKRYQSEPTASSNTWRGAGGRLIFVERKTQRCRYRRRWSVNCRDSGPSGSKLAGFRPWRFKVKSSWTKIGARLKACSDS